MIVDAMPFVPRLSQPKKTSNLGNLDSQIPARGFS
jgi:hypothetical protein